MRCEQVTDAVGDDYDVDEISDVDDAIGRVKCIASGRA